MVGSAGAAAAGAKLWKPQPIAPIVPLATVPLTWFGSTDLVRFATSCRMRSRYAGSTSIARTLPPAARVPLSVSMMRRRLRMSSP